MFIILFFLLIAFALTLLKCDGVVFGYYEFHLSVPGQTITSYLVVQDSIVTGIFGSLNDFNAQYNNALLPIAIIHNNDNMFIFGNGTSPFGITANGVGVAINGVGYALFFQSYLQAFDGSNSFPVAATATVFVAPVPPTFAPTPLPTAAPTYLPTLAPTVITYGYYQFELTIPGNTITSYITVKNNIVTGIYSSLSDYNIQINNAVLPKNTVHNNDNIFVFGTGKSPYGVTANGVGVALNGAAYCIFYDTYMQATDGSTAIPVVVSATAIGAPVAPTYAPTPAATLAPTATPTAMPSAEPTTAPTATPTSIPTTAPTSVPTDSPTSNPTVAPVKYFEATLTIPAAAAASRRWFSQSGTTITTYYTAQAGIVTGVYGSLADYNALTNNEIIALGGYRGNDNVFTGGSTAPYGITANGIAFTNNGKQCDLSFVSSFTLDCGSGDALSVTPVTSVTIVSAAAPTSTGSSTNGSGSSTSNSAPSSLAALAVLVVVPIAALQGLCWCFTYRKTGTGGTYENSNTRDKGPWTPTEGHNSDLSTDKNNNDEVRVSDIAV